MIVGNIEKSGSLVPINDNEYVTKKYVDDNGGGGGIPEAPKDGKQYGREDGTWTEVLNTPGDDGSTFTPVPTVTDNTLNLSWTNNGGLPNPTPVSVVAPKGDTGDTGASGQNAVINGVNVLTITEGSNIELEQVTDSLTINVVDVATEAPIDDKIYGRKNSGWIEIQEDEFVKKYSQFFSDSDIVNGKINISHNLGTQDIIVSVYDNNNEQIIPNNINIFDTNNLTIDMTSFVPITDNYRLMILGYSETKNVGEVFKLNYESLKSLTSSSAQSEINAVFDLYGGITPFITTVSSLPSFIIYLNNETEPYPNDIVVTYQLAKLSPNTLDMVYYDDIKGVDVKVSFIQDVDTGDYAFTVKNVSTDGAKIIQAQDEADAISKSQSDTENFYYWV